MTLWKGRATTRVQAYLRTRLVWDGFGTAASNGWGTTDNALAWTTSGGSASDYSIAGGLGLTSLGSVNTARFVTAGSGIGDVEITTSVTIPVVAATANIHAIVLARFVDTSNWYGLLLDCDTGGQVDVKLCKMVGGSFSTLATASNWLDYAAGTIVDVRFQCYDTNLGASLKARAWSPALSDEPDNWTLEDVVDNSPELLLGGVGVRGLLAVGNTNTLPVVLSWGPVTAYSPPRWTAIPTDLSGPVPTGTGHVMVGSRGATIIGLTGRSTELATIDPAEMSFVLDDPLGWYTPGSTLSPFYPDWTDGVPIRWSETIGARTFTFPDVFVEIGETSLSFETTPDGELTDRSHALRCVDLLTKLNQAPAFVSNLGEHIKYNATPGALRAYWPLVDPAGSTYATSAGPVNQDPLRYEQPGELTPVRIVDTLVTFGDSDGPFGDDSPCVRFPVSGDYGVLASNSVALVVTDEDIVTIAVWVHFTGEDIGSVAIRSIDNDVFIALIDFNSPAQWAVSVSTDNDTNVLAGQPVIANRWHLIGGRFNFATGDQQLWVDTSDPATATMLAGGSGNRILARVLMNPATIVAGDQSYAHLQVYLGDAFTHADFLAQYDVGMNGFGQQTVDERIRMICNFAGLPDSRLDLEGSDSLIQGPVLAGRRPGERATSAAVTGGGILFTQGDRFVYQDRKHRFGL